MMREALKTWVSRLLLAFVLITLGFAWGKQSARKEAALTHGGAQHVPEAGNKVVAFAAHMTFRCHECTEIERMTHALIVNEFAEELAGGQLSFRVIDYQKNPEFARQHHVFSSTVVLVAFRDGVEVGSDRLDHVWTLANDADQFNAYLRGALRERLLSLEGES